MTAGFWRLVIERRPALGAALVEHLWLTYVAVGIAIVIGLPLGLWVTRSARVRAPVLGLVGIVQTVPSLALLGLLLPLLGIGLKPAIVALALYALLPIVRNTYAGLDGVPGELIEAADGVGFTARQRFWQVELPLAMPVIVTGIRTATVISVGVATLAAFIGAGGLGEFIFRGLQRNHNELILLGAGPAALLALYLDAVIGRVEASLRRDPVSGRRPSPVRAAAWGLVPTTAVLLASAQLARRPEPAPAGGGAGTFVLGSKNFTEQLILGELLAQLVESETDLRVVRRFGLEGTTILHGALVRGEIDAYPEYTGTGLMDVLKLPAESDPQRVRETVAAAYRERFECLWLAPFGFNNTYTISVRGADADAHAWSRISDLADAAASLRAGFTGEFIEREDGYRGFQRVYGFGFGEVRMLDPGLMYQAAAAGEVDVICAFGTDGRIAAFDLRVLADDRGLFPPYHAAPVVRAEALTAHPELRATLERLAGRIDDATMARLNSAVDEFKRPAAEVAAEFLAELGPAMKGHD